VYILEQRFLRGLNVHADSPCLLSVLDLGDLYGISSKDIPGFNEALLALLPSLHGQLVPAGQRGGFAQRLREGTYLGRVVEQLTLELQTLAGSPVGYGRTKPVAGNPGEFRIVCQYQVEGAAQPAFRLAVDIVDALGHGEPFDLGPRLGELARIVDACAIGPGAEAVLAAAQERGVPVQRIAEDANLFQLGWGSKQKRLQATSTSQSGLVEVKIGGDKPLAGPLLADAGVPVPQGVEPRDAGAVILRGLMGDSNGRIPLVAVTGTNGKTTTTLLIAHAVAMAGMVTGVATTHGVFIDGKTVAQGDCTGYWSARTVLEAPEVEFAVLETARGGILKRGLAFDRCDVGVVLNVATDHLGLDGVDTVEDLAQVKAVVASSASRAAVLNAQDALCVAMVRRMKPGAEVIFFSMEPDNPVLLKHLGEGGRGAYLQDNAIVIADGKRQLELLRVESMPVAFGGLARFNIANALAAAAALMAIGFSHTQILAGLSTFVSNGKTNPLRTNVFEIRGVTVIVDYAHNAAAYAAMADMACALLPRHLVGIVTAPGDRRDEDLVEIGSVCGERFDELVVYESSSRGRPVGDTVDLILEGAQEVVGLSDTLHREIEVDDAIRLGLSLCAPGDVLVFACGSSLSVFIDAIRVSDPESADRIAAQTA
jgi:UDP-N-acetylmuramyl tripeptide synthase